MFPFSHNIYKRADYFLNGTRVDSRSYTVAEVLFALKKGELMLPEILIAAIHGQNESVVILICSRKWSLSHYQC